MRWAALSAKGALQFALTKSKVVLCANSVVWLSKGSVLSPWFFYGSHPYIFV